jgi:hypothetical protein
VLLSKLRISQRHHKLVLLVLVLKEFSVDPNQIFPGHSNGRVDYATLSQQKVFGVGIPVLGFIVKNLVLVSGILILIITEASQF